MGGERSTTTFVRAHEWLLSTMDSLVRLKITSLGEPLTATFELAYERLLAIMGASVNLQSARARVAFAANVASEGLVTCVDQLVRLQVTLRDESLVTALESAAKRPLARMDAQVGLQVSSLVEFSQTLHKGAEERVLRTSAALGPLEARCELDALAYEQVEEALARSKTSA